MGTTTSYFLSIMSPVKVHPLPSKIHPTYRTKEQRIRDAESEAQVKLDKIRLRILELERQKNVLVLSMERIQYRLGERITRINREHDEHNLESTVVQVAVPFDNTDVATKVTQTLKTAEIAREEPLETVQCVTSEVTVIQSETVVTDNGLGQTHRPETHPVTDTPDIATNEPFITEQEESLLNQLLYKKLNYLQSCDNGIDVNTGAPIPKSKPHIYMTALEKSLLNELGTMCMYDLWHRKGLKLKDLYIRHTTSKTLPSVTEDTDKALQESAVHGQENVPLANKSTTSQQLLDAYGRETIQLANGPTPTQQIKNNSMCLCNTLPSSSQQVLCSERVTFCLSDMLASCSQQVTKTHGQKTTQITNKSTTGQRVFKKDRLRRVQQANKSPSSQQNTRSRSNLSSQNVMSGITPQDKNQKKPYACSYDPSFWRQIQHQPQSLLGENAGKENEKMTKNQPDFMVSWRNASEGENKADDLTGRLLKKTSAYTQANISTSQPLSKSGVAAEKVNASAVNRDTKSQSKQAIVESFNAPEALKIAVKAIRKCPQVISSIYRLEHLTNTLESQIEYLEGLSSFSMYLKAPLIMREVCAKLDPYFLWDWCEYANENQARAGHDIHRKMLNFLKKKVHCSSLYLRPYYEESTLGNLDNNQNKVQ